MKTNEQTLEDLLKRKEAYDKKRAASRRRAALISAALAIILIASSIPVIAFVANKKAPAPEQAADEVETDLRTDQTTDNSVDESKIETDTFIENETIKSGTKTNVNLSNINAHYFDIIRMKISSEPDEVVLYDSAAQSLVNLGISACSTIEYCFHEDVKEYEISITRSENYTDDKAYFLVIPSESIELLTKDFNLLDFENTETNSVRIKYKYKDGYSNGRIEYMIFNEDDGLELYSDIDNYITKRDLSSGYENIYSMSIYLGQPSGELAFYYDESFCFATVKEYDFVGYVRNIGVKLDTLYRFAANYFEDVDDKGNPLFESDPYMPEYYDNPGCFNKRHIYETRPIYDGQTGLRGDYKNFPLVPFTEEKEKSNSKGGVVHQYNASFDGHIYWSDINDTPHVARNIKLKVLNASGLTEICETSTNTNGYYTVEFNYPAVEPLNIVIKAYTEGQSIDVVNINNDDPYEYDLIYINDLPINYNDSQIDGVVSSNSTSDEELFNSALSVHQALEVANRYINSRTSDVNISNISVYYFDDLYESSGELIGSQYFPDIDLIVIEQYDCFDWDIIEHEYGHYIEKTLGFYNVLLVDNIHPYEANLNTYYTKQNAIEMAWNEGFADFFSINLQSIMINSNETQIPHVRDIYYDDIDLVLESDDVYYILYDKQIKIDIENFTDLTSSPFTQDVIYKGETNEITVAALLLDFVDGTSSTDNDYTEFSDSTIWSIIIGDETDPDDGCKTLSDFMNAFHDTTLLSGSQKLICLYLLRRYELNPYNVSVTNVGSGSPLVSWTNTSAYSNFYNRIRFFDTSFNEIGNPIFTTYQTSYNIPAATWSAKTTGRTAVFIVVEGMTALDSPMTYRYYSQVCYVVIP